MKESNEELFKKLIADNKLGIKDEKLFDKESRKYTLVRTKEIIKTPIKGNFDYQHLKNIHKYIFQDVFHWAGKDRNDMKIYGFMSKGNSVFCAGEYIPKEAEKIFTNLQNQNYFKDCKDLNHFAKNISNFLSDLNALHPFREGNGRTQRIFINQLAKNAGYKLDLNLIPKEKIITASIEAMECKNTKLEALIKTNLKSFKQNLEKENALGLSLC
ncbi:TPA: Fic family protein [Campylobacter fetus subsp. venerealis]|nr:Fic family protein [Campylobacter fetus subsp. venerealis]HDX6315319.1 Fic family protein [Campylobacter fetus subsp. venerealis]HDX8126113.1 Fic family protein [Campylobacter fetus subsp. venerealis]HDX8133973.1 Fic family protein [Campylobacter fetus subsp. venerealis]HDX8141304.1 Fic family protein [Campylobacter fetus subsp. venerealis]